MFLLRLSSLPSIIFMFVYATLFPVQTPSHISPELISIGDQVRVKNRLLPSLSTTLGVNRTTASRCLRVPYPPEL
uniref:Secreted protein n=1 Tax=Aegilops tauschii subsp. strangulata TaxID=200361 RepID=A0A453I236_AEGTS